MTEYYNNVREGIHYTQWTFWRLVLAALPIILLFSIGGFIISRGCGVVNEVTDPRRMVYTYEHFHDLYQKVEAADVMIRDKKQQIEQFMLHLPDNWREDMNLSRDFRNLQVDLSGLVQHRANLVAEYNANAAKVTRGFLRDSNLPERLN